MLYQKISKKGKEKNAVNTEFAVSRMLVMGKVLYGLHLVKLSFILSIYIIIINEPAVSESSWTGYMNADITS